MDSVRKSASSRLTEVNRILEDPLMTSRVCAATATKETSVEMNDQTPVLGQGEEKSATKRRTSFEDIEELEKMARKIDEEPATVERLRQIMPVAENNFRSTDNATQVETAQDRKQSPTRIAYVSREKSPEEVVTSSRRLRFKALAADIENFEVEYKPKSVDKTLLAKKTVLGTQSPVLSRNKMVDTTNHADSFATPDKAPSNNGTALQKSGAKSLSMDVCGIDAFFRPVGALPEPVTPASEQSSPTGTCGIEAFFRKKSPVVSDNAQTTASPIANLTSAGPKVQFSDVVAFINTSRDTTFNSQDEAETQATSVTVEAQPRVVVDTKPVVSQSLNALKPGHVAMLAKRFESSPVAFVPLPKVLPPAKKIVEAEVKESEDQDGRSPKRGLDSTSPETFDRVKRVRNKWQEAEQACQSFQPDDVSDISYADSASDSRNACRQDTKFVDVQKPVSHSDETEASNPFHTDEATEEIFTYSPNDEEVFGDVNSASLSENSSLDYSEVSSMVLTGGEETPCQRRDPPDTSKLRSVSSYRTNVRSHMTATTPNKLVYKYPATEERQNAVRSTPSINSQYVQQIQELKKNEGVQLEQIHQATRALNFCFSLFDHRDSPEELDAQKALLLATQKRNCIAAEISRLANSVRERRLLSSDQPLGTLIVSHISVPLRMTYIRDTITGDTKMVYYFICLLKHREFVYSTQMLSSDVRETGFLEFSNYFQISPLAPDFQLKFELYSLSCLKSEGQKQSEKKNTFPSTWKRSKAPPVVSRGGPGSVTESAFALVGSATITLANVRRNRFTLENLNMCAPVDGFFMMRSRCCPQTVLALKESGFLNVLNKDGTWSLFWCVLQNGVLDFWRFPEDANKEPCKTIDLHLCVSASRASEEVTTRARAIILEVFDPDLTEDEAHSELLSADTDEEFEQWLKSVEEVLRFNSIWGSTAHGSVGTSTAV